MKINNYHICNYSAWWGIHYGLNKVKVKLNDLSRYLNWERKQSMSRPEVRLYEWILKKQHKAGPIELHDLVEETDSQGWTHMYKTNERYYIGYYLPRKYSLQSEEDKYAKEQQKYRARHSTKMG